MPGRCYTGSPTVRRVVAEDGNRRRIAVAALEKSLFHMRIATPGIYTLEAVGGRNDHTIWSRTQVRVRAGQTASVVLTVSIE